MIPARPAQLPTDAVSADDLPRVVTTADTAPDDAGWDPRFSRLVTVTRERPYTFHVLDTGQVLDELGLVPEATIVAVHGNPTWSYLWRGIARRSIQAAAARLSSKTRNATKNLGPVIRVIAPDQLDMGFSERLPHPTDPAHRGQDPRTYRTLEERIDDLDALVDTLVSDPAQPIFTLGHDWGGVVSLGWATRARERGDQRVTGMMSLNTAVHHPPQDPVPAPLRAALAGPLLTGSTITTPAFNAVSHSLAESGVARPIKDGYQLPYRTAEQRGGVGGFVADIPTDSEHRSHEALQQVSDRLAQTDVPLLMLWGAQDPVFLDRYLHDLQRRVTNIDVHHYNHGGHLLVEDIDISEPIFAWITTKLHPELDGATTGRINSKPHKTLWHFLDAWRDSETKALVDMSVTDRGQPFKASWAQLSSMIDAMAIGLRTAGMKPGDRVSMLVPAGRDLTAALYAVLRVGGVAVVADQGLGIQGMTRAIRTSNPQWIIGETPGLTLARVQNLPGTRISMKQMGWLERKALGVSASMYGYALRYRGEQYAATTSHPDPGPEDLAAILFTSGSTGPAKGVRYTHERLSNLTQLLRDAFGIDPGSSLLAGFAPFALLGPAIGATSVSPDMDVTKPSTLTASALADAALASDATIAFGSPAALTNVVATARELKADQRDALARIDMMLSAGAPVTQELSEQVQRLLPTAEFHTPYGMTESLLLADIEHRSMHPAVPDQAGVCVGRPVQGVRLMLAPLSAEDGTPSDELVEPEDAVGVLSELVVSAPHMREGYDQLWYTTHRASRDTLDGLAWHRTGDIGHVDAEGLIWIEGRTQHVISTPAGPVGPGGPEDLIVRLDEVNRAAVVGHGPEGTQAVIAVVELTDSSVSAGLASTALTDKVREAAAPLLPEGQDIAAVLVTTKVPVDIRHNSKIDRSRLAAWADRILTGGKVTSP